MGYAEILKTFPLLAKISDEDLLELAGILEERRFSAGEDILKEGDTGSEMYILIDGTVDVIRTTVYGDHFICATLDGSMHCVFGEMAMIDNDKRSATVRAKTDCKTLVIDDIRFNHFLDHRPQAGVELLRFISMNLVRNIRIENANLNLVFQALIEEIEEG
jgi:CRP-like cAMP-binding protein